MLCWCYRTETHVHSSSVSVFVWSVKNMSGKRSYEEEEQVSVLLWSLLAACLMGPSLRLLVNVCFPLLCGESQTMHMYNNAQLMTITAPADGINCKHACLTRVREESRTTGFTFSALSVFTRLSSLLPLSPFMTYHLHSSLESARLL